MLQGSTKPVCVNGIGRRIPIHTWCPARIISKHFSRAWEQLGGHVIACVNRLLTIEVMFCDGFKIRTCLYVYLIAAYSAWSPLVKATHSLTKLLNIIHIIQKNPFLRSAVNLGASPTTQCWANSHVEAINSYKPLHGLAYLIKDTPFPKYEIAPMLKIVKPLNSYIEIGWERGACTKGIMQFVFMPALTLRVWEWYT